MGLLRPLAIITRQHFWTGWSRPEVKTDFESWQTMPRSAERGQSISSFLARDRDVCCLRTLALARGNIIPPSPRPLRGRAERRWGERNLLLAVPLSLHRKRDTNHTIAVAGCWPMGGARKCTSTSLQMVDPFPPAFYTESGKGTLETTRYICTKSWGNKISNIPPLHRKLCVVCVTPLGYSLARFVSTIVDGRRGKQKQGMMMKAL